MNDFPKECGTCRYHEPMTGWCKLFRLFVDYADKDCDDYVLADELKKDVKLRFSKVIKGE